MDDYMMNIRMIEYFESDCNELWKENEMWFEINGFLFENVVVVKV